MRKILVLLLSLFSIHVLAETLTVAPGFTNGGQFSTLDFIKFNVTDSLTTKSAENLVFTGPQGPITNADVVWGTHCDPGYTKDPDGKCQKVETVAPTLTCATGYTLQSGECRRVDTQMAVLNCPTGYTALNGQCQKADSIPATKLCSSGLFGEVYTYNPSTDRCETVVEQNIGSSFSLKCDAANPNLAWDYQKEKYQCYSGYFFISGESGISPLTLTCPGGALPTSSSTCPGSTAASTAPTCVSGRFPMFRTPDSRCANSSYLSVSPPSNPTIQYSIGYNSSNSCQDLSQIKLNSSTGKISCNAINSKAYSLSCPTDYILSGTQCNGTLYNAGTYQCSSAEYSYIGNGQCQATLSQVAGKLCSTGFSLINGATQCQRITVGINRLDTFFQVKVSSLFPGEHSIEVGIRNNYNDTAKTQATFTYMPKGFALSNGKTELSIPAVAHDFTRLDGAKPLQTGVLKSGSTNLTGITPVYASIPSTLYAGIKVDGQDVLPGQSIKIGDYDLTATGSKLSLYLSPLAEMQYSIPLLITIGDNNPVVSLINVKVWEYNQADTNSGTKPTTAFDTFTFKAGEKTNDCALTTELEFAKQADIYTKATCYIKFTQVPVDLSLKQPDPQIEGTFITDTPEKITYTVYLSDYDGTLYELYSNSLDITPQLPFGMVAIEPANPPEPVVRGVQQIDMGFRTSLNSKPCNLTTSVEIAKAPPKGDFTCLVEFSFVPNGLQSVGDLVKLQGVLASESDNILTWSISAYDKNSNKVLLNSQQYNFKIVQPTPPEIALNTKEVTEDGTWLVDLTKSSIGTANVSSAPALISLKFYINGNLISTQDSNILPTSGSSQTFQLKTDGSQYVDSVNLTVEAYYTLMEEIKTTVDIKAIVLPDSNLYLTFTEDTYNSVQVKNNDTIKLKVELKHALQPDFKYDKSRHGTWLVSLATRKTFSEYESIETPVELNDSGIYETEYKIPDGFNSGIIYMYAKGTITNKVLNYTRSIFTRKPYMMNVLYMDPIESTIGTSNMSGQAPLTTTFYINVKDTKLARDIGEVDWYTRELGGNWLLEEDFKTKLYRNVFDEGEYEVKAVIRNSNSGATYEAPTIRVSSVYLPKVKLVSQNVDYIGNVIDINADFDFGESSKSVDDYYMYWSEDNGVTFNEGSTEYSVTNPDPGNVKVKFKYIYKYADKENSYNWKTLSKSLAFVKPSPPRGQIFGSRSIDHDKPGVYKYVAQMRPAVLRPSQTFDGYFELPDGSTIEGLQFDYDTASKLLKPGLNIIKYFGWESGFEELVAEYKMYIYVKEYEFPKFDLYVSNTLDLAPATVGLSVRSSIGFDPDKVSYELKMPDNTDVIYDGSLYKKVQLNSVGKNTFTLVASDIYGNSQEIVKEIYLKQAPPLEMNVSLKPFIYVEKPVDPYMAYIRPTIKMGHPFDRVLKFEHFVDGEGPLKTASGGQAQYSFGEGTHDITTKVTTKYGFTEEINQTLVVYPNQSPECGNLNLREDTTRYIITANCSDDTGLRSYEVIFNGIKSTRTYPVFSYYKNSISENMDRRLAVTAIDLNGQRSQTVYIDIPVPG